MRQCNQVFTPKIYRVSRYLSIQKMLIIVKIILNHSEGLNRFWLDSIESINVPRGGQNMLGSESALRFSGIM